MSWADYGFINNDMALAYMPNTLLAIAKAIDERYRLMMCLNYANGYNSQNPDTYMQGLVNGYPYIKLYNNLAYRGYSSSLYLISHYRDFADSYFSQLGRSTYNDYLTYPTFINGITRNPSFLSYTNVLSEICAELNNEGFTTTPISVVSNYNSPLEYANNKHWIIQRKRMLDKYRYVYSINYVDNNISPRYKSNTKIVTTQAQTSDVYYNTVNEALANLTNVVVSSFTSSRPSYQKVICKFDIYNNKICINELIDSFIVTKSFVDDAISNCLDLTAPQVQMRIRDTTSLLYNGYIIHEVDLNDIVTYDGIDYYKIKYNPSRSDIISILSNLNYAQYDGYSEITRVGLESGFGQFFDGANYFSFLDIA